jgi:hypothetical protein
MSLTIHSMDSDAPSNRRTSPVSVLDYDLRAATFALYTGQKELARTIVEQVKLKRIAKQILRVTPFAHRDLPSPQPFPRPLSVSSKSPALESNRRHILLKDNKMSSEARQIANSVNALLSTGPRTEEGKARSSQNARKHGLTSAEIILAFEDREEFEELKSQFETDIRPQGAIQQTLFDQLVASAWNLRRIRRMEYALTDSAAHYMDLIENVELTVRLDRLARHQTRIERSFQRALRELKALQTEAALTTTLPAGFMQNAPPLASRIQIAKRTQTLAAAARKYASDDDWSPAETESRALYQAARLHQPRRVDFNPRPASAGSSVAKA